MKKPKVEMIDLIYSKPEQKQPNKKRNTKEKSKEKKVKSNKNNKNNKINLDDEIIAGVKSKKEGKPKKHATKTTQSEKKQSKTTKTNKTTGRSKINLDNEIVIGLTPKKGDKKDKKQSTKNGEVKKTNKKSSKKKNKVSTKKRTVKKLNNEFDVRKAKGFKIFKRLVITIVAITCIMLFMLSSVFHIKEIIVSHNIKLSSEEIIVVSGLQPGINMFKINIGRIKENLKKNPYIEEVKIIRNLNGIVDINIVERIPTYVLIYKDEYAYINNQGYILEISDTPLELPFIIGFQTEMIYIEPGKRLIKEDLMKLETAIKIMEIAKLNNIANLITSIDISNDKEYILNLETEGKIVYFGDSSKINQKMLWIVKLIEEVKGIDGEIIFKDNNIDRAIFREKV